MQKWFRMDARVQATELLLQERPAGRSGGQAARRKSGAAKTGAPRPRPVLVAKDLVFTTQGVNCVRGNNRPAIASNNKSAYFMVCNGVRKRLRSGFGSTLSRYQSEREVESMDDQSN